MKLTAVLRQEIDIMQMARRTAVSADMKATGTEAEHWNKGSFNRRQPSISQQTGIAKRNGV